MNILPTNTVSSIVAESTVAVPAVDLEQGIERSVSQESSKEKKSSASTSIFKTLGGSEERPLIVSLESSEDEQLVSSDSPLVKKAKALKYEMLDDGAYIDSRNNFLMRFEMEQLEISYWIREIQFWEAQLSKNQ